MPTDPIAASWTRFEPSMHCFGRHRAKVGAEILIEQASEFANETEGGRCFLCEELFLLIIPRNGPHIAQVLSLAQYVEEGKYVGPEFNLRPGFRKRYLRKLRQGSHLIISPESLYTVSPIELSTGATTRSKRRTDWHQ